MWSSHLLNLVNFQEFQHLKSPVARLKRYPLSLQHFKPPQHTNTTNKRRQNMICPSSPCWHSHAQQSVLKQCICCCIQHEAQAMPAALGLQVLFGLLTNISASSKRPPDFFCAKQDICKVYFSTKYLWKIPTAPKKKHSRWPSGKTSLCKGLPSGTCCLPCCDFSSLKLGDEWQKLVASTSRLVSWFKLWNKCI